MLGLLCGGLGEHVLHACDAAHHVSWVPRASQRAAYVSDALPHDMRGEGWFCRSMLNR